MIGTRKLKEKQITQQMQYSNQRIFPKAFCIHYFKLNTLTLKMHFLNIFFSELNPVYKILK